MSVLDTNVLVYSTAPESPHHRQARAAIAGLVLQERVAITRQILREYIAATTRPQSWSKPYTLEEATGDAEAFATRFMVLEDSDTVWREFRMLARRVAFGGKQVHDANIVATMLAHGERRLPTFNTADFRRFEGMIELVAP